MKRLIRNKPSKELEIVIYVEEVQDKVVANYVDHPSSIKRSKLISDTKLRILNDVVATAISNIGSYFEIKEKYPGDAYSYYILFEPVDKDGQAVTPVRIKFRIANHPINHGHDDYRNARNVIIRSFDLSGERYENSIELTQQILHICEMLYQGHPEVLDNY